MLRMRKKKVLYVSGEESAQQIKKMRADRIGGETGECYSGRKLRSGVFSHIKNMNPDIIIIDSIQTIASEIA